MNRPAVAATTAAMSEIVPLADEPLRLATSAFAAQAESDSRKTAALILALGLDVPTGDRPADLVQVEMRIFDGEGRKQLDQRDLAVRLPASSNQARLHDVFIVTTLKPGRYNVRVSTFSTLRNRAGSVYTDISVPDFYKTPFAVSDPVVFQSPGSTTHGVASIEAMKLPLPPTTIRVFEQKQRGVVFTRAYWGRRTSNPQPASLIATVTNDQNRDVWRVAQLVLPSRSEPIASADVQFDLPLNELPPGEYLFKLVARSKNQSDIVKHVRFTVR
jgi:hypothetical protein